MTRERQDAASGKTGKVYVEKQCLECRAPKGASARVRSLHGLPAVPGTSLVRRSVFLGTLAMVRRESEPRQSSNLVPSLPFDRSIWPNVVRELELCPQQARVVDLLMRGMGDKQIALSLGLSEPTIRTYLGRIFSRLGVRGRVELILRIVSVAWDIGERLGRHQKR
jgi:DNA-binding CsgD family transcriptional regulator